jgi:hypothetical protein
MSSRAKRRKRVVEGPPPHPGRIYKFTPDGKLLGMLGSAGKQLK